MHRAIGTVASVAAAFGCSAHGALVDALAGKIPLLDTPADKFIAGIPVLNYDQAYQGNVQSLDDPSGGLDAVAHTEDWIVVLKPEATDEQIDKVCEQAAAGCFQIGHQGGFPFAAVRGSEEELAAAVAGNRQIARYIHPDQVVSLEPEDERAPGPKVSEGSPQAALWGLARIGADKRDYTGRGVHVYVVDTGIRTDHIDFGGRAVPYIDVFIGTNGTNLCSSSQDETCSGDRQGHGTHCAGTIAGETYGVAPDAVVHAVKVLSDQGSGTTIGIVAALDLIALYAQRPAVTSMSLGGPSPRQAYVDAIDELSHRGVTVVVSAGNDYFDACRKAPAYVPSAITVGSTDSQDMRSGFSNFGTCVDIWAPGSGIESADGTAGTDNNYSSRILSGTSMSCPHVSGGAALLLEAVPSFTSIQILAKMYDDASVNYIGDLSPNDTNVFLYVGRDAPQAPQPIKDTSNWPPQEFFDSCGLKGQSGPRGDYPVCMCADRNTNRVNGTRCYNGYTLGCPLGPMEEINNNPNSDLSWYYSLWNCTECHCYAEGQEPQPPPTPAPSPTPAPGSNTAWWALGGVIAVGAAIAAAVCGCSSQGQSRTVQGDGDVVVEMS